MHIGVLSTYGSWTVLCALIWWETNKIEELINRISYIFKAVTVPSSHLGFWGPLSCVWLSDSEVWRQVQIEIVDLELGNSGFQSQMEHTKNQPLLNYP